MRRLPINRRASSALALSLGLMAALSTLPQPAVRAAVGPGENPVDLRFAALEAVMRGDSSNALDLFNTAIQEASKQYGASSVFLADLYYEAGSVALDASQFGQAEHYLTLAVKANPYSTMAKIKLAELYRVQDRAEDASRQFRQAVQINPNSPVTRQAYIRWLSANGSSTTEKAIANQEALRLAMLRAKSSESSKGASVKTLAPAMIPPKGKGSGEETSPAPKPAEPAPPAATTQPQEAARVKETQPPAENKGPSLFPLRSLKGQSKANQADAETERKQKALIEEAKRKAEAIIRAAQEEAERKARAAKAEARAREHAPIQARKAEPKPEKSAPAKPEKTQPTNIVPAPAGSYLQPTQQMQPVYPSPGVFLPASKPKVTPKGGFVPPPPPAPIPVFPSMPMMNQAQPPTVVPQAKPKAKPKEPPKEQTKEQPKEQPAAEDKPPPMTNPSDSEAEWMIDWAEVPKNKKKGK